MKQKYYRLDRIKKENAEYNLLLGERSNGKSYAVKEECLLNAWEDKSKFIYMRRWQIEVKTAMVESYFADAPVKSITKNQCNAITVFRGGIYFSIIDDDGTTTRVKLAGKIVYLSGAEHFKSLSYPDYDNIIFEEFVTNSGYLNDEVTSLMSLISTIARRRSVKVWMIANTVSRICPYFREWELINIPNQKQGTIEIYERRTDQTYESGNPVIIRIAVEFCENSGNNSKMFFGASAKMITSGAWDSTPQPHLPHNHKEYEILYRVLLEYNGFSYVIEALKRNETFLLFVHPFTGKKKPNRIISDIFSDNPLTTERLYELTAGDRLVNRLVKLNKICFSDNLTGSEFYNIIKEKGEI